MGCQPLRTIKFKRIENSNSPRNPVLGNGITSLRKHDCFLAVIALGDGELRGVGHRRPLFPPGKGQDVLGRAKPGLLHHEAATRSLAPCLAWMVKIHLPLLSIQATSLPADLTAPVPPNITSKLLSPAPSALHLETHIPPRDT